MVHYFDYSATTPPQEELIQIYAEACLRYGANPASTHNSGKAARKAIDEAKAEIAELLSCHAEEIIFTSSATESINTVIKSVALSSKQRDGYLLSLAAEHPATYESLNFCEHYLGRRIARLPLQHAQVNLAALKDFLQSQTVDLLTCVLVNNLSGAIYPLQDIAKLLRQYAPQARLHVDAVQALGKIPVSFSQLDADYLSLSLHKIGAPKGSGLLLAKQDKRLIPLLHGGGQQDNLRSSTENPALAVVSAAALRKSLVDSEQKYARAEALKVCFLKALAAEEDTLFTYQLIEADPQVPHIVSLIIPALRGQNLQAALSREGYELAIGSACASKKAQVPAALKELGLSDVEARHLIRVSIAPWQTEQEVQGLAQCLAAQVRRYAVPSKFTQN